MTVSSLEHARLTRLTVSNYRSIGENVSIDFEPLTVLVGINGSGKSNLLDAPRFIAHALTDGLESAVESRHGFDAIQRDAGGKRGSVRIELALSTESWTATYEIELGRSKALDFAVQSERLEVTDDHDPRVNSFWKNRLGNVISTWPGLDTPVRDKRNLSLIAIGGDERLAAVVDALRSIETYSLFPEELRKAQPPGPREYLTKFGENWPSIVRRVMSGESAPYLRLALERVTGDIIGVRASRPIAGLNAVEFEHARGDGKTKWFPASRQSDGTLRVAGILTALVQEPPLTMIGIEEPEQTVHAGVLGVLADFLAEAAAASTVVVTTHSPELIDLVPVEGIRVVNRVDGTTRVGRLDQGQQALVRKQLESPGGLLRSQGLLAEEE